MVKVDWSTSFFIQTLHRALCIKHKKRNCCGWRRGRCPQNELRYFQGIPDSWEHRLRSTGLEDVSKVSIGQLCEPCLFKCLLLCRSETLFAAGVPGSAAPACLWGHWTRHGIAGTVLISLSWHRSGSGNVGSSCLLEKRELCWFMG